jgi:hypothetical protein
MSRLQKIVVSAPMAVGQLKVQLGKMDKKHTSQYIHISNRIMIFSTRAADYISLIPQKEEMACNVTKPQTQAAIQDLRFILEKLESMVDLEFANSTISSSAA